MSAQKRCSTELLAFRGVLYRSAVGLAPFNRQIDCGKVIPGPLTLDLSILCYTCAAEAISAAHLLDAAIRGRDPTPSPDKYARE